MKSNFSSGKSSAAQRKAEPALLTRMSTRPSSCLTESARATHCARWVTSRATARALPPCAVMVACGRFGALRIDIGDDDLDADLREAGGDGRPQPAAAAGDDGNPALEVEEPGGIAGGHR